MPSLKEATTLYDSLLKVASKFKSPVFKSYFKNKAKEDYNDLIKEIDQGKFKCVIDKYLKKNEELKGVLERQSVIYNFYYDKSSNI